MRSNLLLGSLPSIAKQLPVALVPTVSRAQHSTSNLLMQSTCCALLRVASLTSREARKKGARRTQVVASRLGDRDPSHGHGHFYLLAYGTAKQDQQQVACTNARAKQKGKKQHLVALVQTTCVLLACFAHTAQASTEHSTCFASKSYIKSRCHN